ncbi:copper chaperone PCu(A)C [Thalassovita taeanensis]|uniref:Copper chaperone PCu(A)C n=1 Tax=Thalassovita taeanensis TaxID=657014 RepID=A0A1H9JYB5_9RHOB|nr:copper chaperone PCu(A)C [Thalassovita taeanensis]SEQ91849.1 hypothetical protein SAMN04488092_11691 [Thalassovita taeanensis]
MMRILSAAMILLPALAQADGITAQKAYIPPAPPTARVHAAYMSLHNSTDTIRSLIGVTAEGYGMAHLHQSMTHGGVASMSPVAQLDIPAHGAVELAPGGLHIMLMMPQGVVSAGTVVNLSLTFSDGEVLAVPAVVEDRDAAS